MPCSKTFKSKKLYTKSDFPLCNEKKYMKFDNNNNNNNMVEFLFKVVNFCQKTNY